MDRKNDPLSTENLLLKGDNLDCLKILKSYYSGRIKCIYIDPPYNTANDEFVYPDKFDREEQEVLGLANISETDFERMEFSFHTKKSHNGWLSFIYPRLLLARDLLARDGVIFISIDDNEQANLKLLCDEIFGEENFVGCLKWKRKKQPSFLHGQIAGVMEYILIFAKNRDNLERLSIETRNDFNTRVDNQSNAISERFIKKGIRAKLDDRVIKAGMYQNKTMSTEYLDDIIIKDRRTMNDFRVRARFRNDQAGIDKFVENDVIFITKNLGFRRDLLEEELLKRKSITDLLLDWGDNQDSAVTHL